MPPHAPRAKKVIIMNSVTIHNSALLFIDVDVSLSYRANVPCYAFGCQTVIYIQLLLFT